MFKIIFYKQAWSEMGFVAALFVIFSTYIIFWQKAIWPWYVIWALPLGLIITFKSADKNIRKMIMWMSLSPLFYYVVYLINYLITKTDLTTPLWLNWFMVLSNLAYPAYCLVKWRKQDYKLEL
jgi:hypothetical protein